MTEISWKSRTAKEDLPDAVFVNPFSRKVCITIAVEDMEKEGKAAGKGRLPGETCSKETAETQQCRSAQLDRSCSRDELTHPPEAGGFQFKADEKEHHHHAEFGEVHDVLAFLAHKTKKEGADDNAAQEVAQHRTHSQLLRDGYEHDGGGEIDQGIVKKTAVHPSARSFPA
jgi:hypothetical protein